MQTSAAVIAAACLPFLPPPAQASWPYLAASVAIHVLYFSLVAAATGCLIATAKAEERENLRFFGPAYAATMRQTRRFIPFLF